MKFIVAILCLCSVVLAQLDTPQNEETTTTTTTVVSETTTSPFLESSTTLQTSEATTPTPVTESTTITSTSEVPVVTTSFPTTVPVAESTTSTPVVNKTIKIVDKLSDQIRSVLSHYHESNPIGFPGQTILMDPMPVPNNTADLGIGTGYFYNLTVHGLSNFTVEAVNMLLDDMQVYVMLHMKTIIVKGNCTIQTMFTTSKSPFNMTLYNVTAEGTVTLRADAEGKLHANKSSTDMSYQELKVGVNNNPMIQTMMNGAGVIILAGIRPYILKQVDARLNEEVNKQLENAPKMPSISNISPVDLAIIEGRKYIRKSYDPYTIKNVTYHESEYLIVNISQVTIYGLSKFARVGNVTVQMRDGIVQVIVRLITGRLKGTCKFFYDFGRVGLVRKGESHFSVNHLQFEAKINQSMNLKNKPILDDLQLEVGTIRVKMDGTGDFDYLLDMTAHLIPDLLRHLIIDALEEPIKQKIQSEILDKINVQQLVEDNLSIVESLLIY